MSSDSSASSTTYSPPSLRLLVDSPPPKPSSPSSSNSSSTKLLSNRLSASRASIRFYITSLRVSSSTTLIAAESFFVRSTTQAEAKLIKSKDFLSFPSQSSYLRISVCSWYLFCSPGDWTRLESPLYPVVATVQLPPLLLYLAN